MTDDPTTDDETDSPDASPATSGYQHTPDGGALTANDERTPGWYLYWGTFAVLLVLALVAVVRFYMSASQAISVWIAADYVPVFQSAFNLAVLFACALGLSVLVRRMRD